MHFFGAGNLAEAIIAGITRSNIVSNEQVLVTNRSDNTRLDLLSEKYGVQCNRNKEEMIQEANIIILAMKPKDAGNYLNWLKDHIKPHHVVISVIAGLSIEQMEKNAWRRYSCYSDDAKYICINRPVSYCYFQGILRPA